MKFRSHLLLIQIITGVTVMGLSCAHLLSPKVSICGSAVLEDKEWDQNGGILVKAGDISNYTDDYGNYEITGNRFWNQELEIQFAKEGYIDTFITLSLSFSLSDTTIYLPEVTLKTAPFDSIITEGFEDTTIPSGWRNIPIDGYWRWDRCSSGFMPKCDPFAGIGMAGYYSYYASERNSARLISPLLRIDEEFADVIVEFWMYHDTLFKEADSLILEYSTDGVNFVRVAAFSRYCENNGWVKHQATLGSFENNNVNVALKAFAGGYGGNIYIDDIKIYKIKKLGS